MRSLDTQYAKWLEVNSSRDATSSKSVPDRHRTQKIWDVRHVGGVPALSVEWFQPERWQLVTKGAWLFDESIFLKEARVEFMGLRHMA